MKLEVLPTKSYAQAAAALVAAALPEHGTVVLTGGTSAARLYPELADDDFVRANLARWLD